MRPQSIKAFDMLFLGSLVLGLVNFFFAYDTTMAELEGTGMGATFMFATLAVGYGINLLLWYFVSRKGSNVARWIFVVLTAIGLVMVPFSLADIPMGQMVLTLIVTVMQIAAIYFLFQPDAKLFFENGGKGSVDPSTFE